MKTIKNIWKQLLEFCSSFASKVQSILKRKRSAESGQFYGASELKKNYQVFFRRGFEVAVILHIVVVSTYLLANFLSGKDKEGVTGDSKPRIVNVTLNDLAPPPSVEEEEEILKPEIIKEDIVEPKKDLTALEPEPVKKKEAEEQTIKTQKELEEIKTPVSDAGDTVSYSYSGPVKVEKEKIEKKIEKEEKPVVKKREKTIYSSFEVEKPPEAVNLAQIQGSMTYPSIAIQASIEGRVTIKVLVGRDGTVIKTGSLTGPDVFYEEVREKVKNLQFTPGLQNGKPVKVWVTVPFNFRLK